MNLLALIVAVNAQISQVNQYSNVCKPVDVRREFGFQKRVVMVVTCECTTQEENDFVDTRNDSIFYRVSFFFPL